MGTSIWTVEPLTHYTSSRTFPICYKTGNMKAVIFFAFFVFMVLATCDGKPNWITDVEHGIEDGLKNAEDVAPYVAPFIGRRKRSPGIISDVEHEVEDVFKIGQDIQDIWG